MITGIMIKREITVFVFFFISQLSPNKFYLYNPVSSKNRCISALCDFYNNFIGFYRIEKADFFIAYGFAFEYRNAVSYNFKFFNSLTMRNIFTQNCFLNTACIKAQFICVLINLISACNQPFPAKSFSIRLRAVCSRLINFLGKSPFLFGGIFTSRVALFPTDV